MKAPVYSENKEKTTYKALVKEEQQDLLRTMTPNEREKYTARQAKREQTMKVPEAVSERVRNNPSLSV